MTGDGFITHKRSKHEQTVMYLIDGSSVGMDGDQTDTITRAIGRGEPIVVNEPSGTRITINPAHIVGAVYNPSEG